MDIRVKDFVRVNEVAFSIEWNKDIAQYVSASTTTPSLSDGSSFDLSEVASGRLGFTWKKAVNPDQGTTLIDNASIVSICFDVLDNNIGIERVNFGSSPTTRKVNVVDEDNERFNAIDGFLSNDCEKDCNAAYSTDIIANCGEVSFINQSISTGLIQSYIWDFGDGRTSIESDPVHAYSNSGDYTVELTITDSESCQDTYSEVISVSIDLDDPVINCPDAIFIECSVSRDPDNTGFATATDNCGDDEITLVFSDEILVDGNCSSILKRTWIASDESGNVGTCEQVISIVDRTGPVITNCPAPIVVNSFENSCSAQVPIPVPTVMDECNDITSFINDYTNSSDATAVYPAGVTTVTWTATDECGNTSTCETTVEVLDIISPQVECIDDITVTVNAGEPGSNVSFSNPTVTDDCGATLEFSHESGSFFLCGTTTVTYFAVDAAGNNSEVCTFNVFIQCSDASCCISQATFDGKVNPGYNYVVDNNTIFMNPLALDDCNQVLYDWGDGFTSSALGGLDMAVHEYVFPGEYTICAQIQEIDENEDVCFQEVVCMEVCIAFETCEDPPLTNTRALAYGSTAFEEGKDVTIGPDGDIYMTGTFSGTTDFGGIVRNTFGNKDIYIAKFDGDTGAPLWVTQAGGLADEDPKDIQVDANGNIFIAGSFNSQNITFYSSPEAGGPAQTLTNDNIICNNDASGCKSDAFLAKYDPDGSLLWVFGYGEQENDCISGISIDGEGNLIATGYFSLDVDFDPGEAEFKMIGGTRDIFVSKYNNDGLFQWAFRVGSTTSTLLDEGTSVATDPNNNIYISGYFSGDDVDFDPADGLETLLSAGTSRDIFVARYDKEGDLTWAYDIGNTTADRVNIGRSIIYENDRLYLIGEFSGTGPTDFDPRGSSSDENLFASTGSDVFVACYRNSFSMDWAFNLGADGMGTDLAFSADDELLITGTFANSFVDFDPVDNQNELLANSGSTDIFLGKYTSGGDYLSAINISSSNAETAWGIAADQNGNTYLTGGFTDQGLLIDPNGDAGILSNNGSSDIFWGIYRCICPPAEECRTNCDFIAVDYEFTVSPQDSCCFNLLIDNSATNYFSGVRLTGIGAVEFQSATLLDNTWGFANTTSDTLHVEPNAEFVASGQLTPVTFCLGAYQTQTQEVRVELFNANTVACVDTLEFNCEPPAIPQCIEITSEIASCDGDDLIFEIDWINSASFDIASITLSELSLDKVEYTPLDFQYDPVIQNDNGSTQGTAIFRFKNLESDDNLCFQIIAEDTSGQSICASGVICPPTFAQACNACESVESIVSAERELNGNSCCFSIDLVNEFRGDAFRSIRTDLLGNLQFKYQQTTSDWSFTSNASLDTTTWNPISNSPISLDTTRSKINFCVTGFDPTSDNQLVVNWLDGGEEIVCQDTFTLACADPITDQCIHILENSIVCSPANDHELSLVVENRSGFDAERIIIENFYSSSATAVFEPGGPINEEVTILNTAPFTVPTITIKNGQAGDTICFDISLFDGLGATTQQACYTEEVCYILPDCTSCSCQPWQSLTISDPDNQWTAFNNVQCGSAAITLPLCNYQFCIDGQFACSGDDCAEVFNWVLTKQGNPIPVVTDTIMGTTISNCFDLSPGAFPVGFSGPGIYELQINSECGINQCEQCVLSIEVVCDVNCAPEIVCPDDIHLDCFGPVDLPSPTFTDTCGNRSFSCSRDDLMSLTDPFLKDTTCVTCIALNSNGLQDTCTYKVIVDNPEPLTVQCPDDIQVELPLGELSSTITFPDPVISNDCNVVWSCNYQSGDTFECGITTVTCTAIDTLLQDTITCTFDVALICKRITNCDSLLVDYTRDTSEPDSCCYFVSLNNNFEADRYLAVRVKTTAPTIISSISTLSGWTASKETTGEAYRLTPPQSFIPIGDLGRVFRICTDEFTTIPHGVELEWLEEVDGNLTSLCPIVMNFDCDTTKCCVGLDEFIARTNAASIDAQYDDCKVTVTANGLGPCDQIFYDWDADGRALDGPYTNGEPVVHVYDQPGEYEICYSINELNRKGETCWEPQTGCLEQKVTCTNICCIDEGDFQRRVNSGFTYLIENCRLTVTPNELNECNRVRWSWGDGSPLSEQTIGNADSFHFFDGPGTFEICMIVEEYDENGQICYSETRSCMEFEIDCQPTCLCGVFENIRFGQSMQNMTCGADPIQLECPQQDIDFNLLADFGCMGNCSAAEVLLEIFRDGSMINTATVPLNGNTLDAAIAYSLLKVPGSYTIVMSSDCGGRECSCELKFIVPEECDCECGEFRSLIIDQDGTEYVPECDGAPIEISSCMGEDLNVKGFYQCEGNACTDNSIIWTLTMPSGVVISNELPAGNFQLNFNSALITEVGDYRIELRTSCGVNTCTCTLIWTQPFCEPCPCPAESPSLAIEAACNKVAFDFGGLEDCDLINVDFGDNSGEVLEAGEAITHWYEETGTYTIRYFVERMESTGLTCSIVDSTMVTIDCKQPVIVDGNIIRNSGFQEANGNVPLNWNLFDPSTTTLGTGTGCPDPNFLNLIPNINQADGERLFYQGDVGIQKDHLYEVVICMRVNKTTDLSNLSSVPAFEVFASQDPAGISSFSNCGDACNRIFKTHRILREGEWILMRFDNWVADADYNFLVVQAANTTGIQGSLVTRIDNIVVTDLTTPTHQFDLDDQVAIYPNPTAAQLFIDFDPPARETFQVRLVNILGQIAVEKEVRRTGRRQTMDLSALTKGIYLLQIVDEEGVLRHMNKIIHN